MSDKVYSFKIVYIIGFSLVYFPQKLKPMNGNVPRTSTQLRSCCTSMTCYGVIVKAHIGIFFRVDTGNYTEWLFVKIFTPQYFGLSSFLVMQTVFILFQNFQKFEELTPDLFSSPRRIKYTQRVQGWVLISTQNVWYLLPHKILSNNLTFPSVFTLVRWYILSGL